MPDTSPYGAMDAHDPPKVVRVGSIPTRGSLRCMSALVGNTLSVLELDGSMVRPLVLKTSYTREGEGFDSSWFLCVLEGRASW